MMKRRIQYALLWMVPALIAAVIVSVVVFGAAAGALWLFAFGDNPWPSTAGPLLTAMFVVVCVASWIALVALAYVVGKKHEVRAAPNSAHLVLPAAATLLLAGLVIAHQWGVGNIATPSDGALCSQYCLTKGFAGSGMPPRDSGDRTCSCLDAQGRETAAVPIEDLIARRH